MSSMCEVCKCSVNIDGGCDSGCGCCNGTPLADTLAERTAQLLAITEEEREEYLDGEGESNPILHAETGPNRFAVMSLFFTDNDGVKIEEDIELNGITVTFFNDYESIELEEGALYEWALNYYKDNY